MPSSGVEVGDRVPDDDSDVDHGVLEFIKPAPWPDVSGPCTPPTSARARPSFRRSSTRTGCAQACRVQPRG